MRGISPDHCLRLAPGDVGHSVVLIRMRSRDGLTQMPPLGSKLVDTAALELISDWVRDGLQSADVAKRQ